MRLYNTRWDTGGRSRATLVDPDIRDRILHSSRAKELSTTEPPQPSIEEVRLQLGGQGVSDEELLLRYIVREQSEIDAMRTAGPAKEYQDMTRPLVLLVQRLLQQKTLESISVQKEGVSILCEKSSGKTDLKQKRGGRA